MKSIDEEIDYRNILKKNDFKNQVSELHHGKMVQRKEDQRKQQQ